MKNFQSSEIDRARALRNWRQGAPADRSAPAAPGRAGPSNDLEGQAASGSGPDRGGSASTFIMRR